MTQMRFRIIIRPFGRFQSGYSTSTTTGPPSERDSNNYSASAGVCPAALRDMHGRVTATSHENAAEKHCVAQEEGREWKRCADEGEWHSSERRRKDGDGCYEHQPLVCVRLLPIIQCSPNQNGKHNDVEKRDNEENE